jgi:hypothetical protein
MKLPFVVAPALSELHLERFRRHIDSDASGWHRRFTESIWRRHQHPSNARLSGWTSPDNRNRRLIHFRDEYGLEGRDFVLRRPYLHLNLTLPAEQIDEYREAIVAGTVDGGWHREPGRAGREKWARGDLRLRLEHAHVHSEDERRDYRAPAGYENLDVVVTAAGEEPSNDIYERPFRVFHDVGLRETLPRGEPRIVEPAELVAHLPAQLELGCGPSIEAGIPHLSTLHRIYGVSRPDYGFVFRAGMDELLGLFRDPEAKYRQMTEIYRACLLAEPTPFYRRMKALFSLGHLVGPVITNNFDCQCADLELPEISLRRYDWTRYYPHIEHDSRARSLLVVGVHADRRLVQMRARRHGLKVLYVDPERYVGPDGRAIDYPVEAPQSDDLFVRATAHDAFAALHAALA